MKKNITVLYHRDNDGFGAAWAVWRKYRNEPETVVQIVSVQYGEPVPDALTEETDHLYIVDFTYPLDIMRELAREHDRITLIDHHKTEADTLKMISEEHTDIEIIYDTTEAACVLTWKHLIPNNTVPDILRYVADRDMWRFKLRDSREINLYISTLRWDFVIWDEFECTESALNAGRALARFQGGQMESDINRVEIMHLWGYDIATANVTTNISEVGDALCKKYPCCDFSMTYFDVYGKRVFSLRSIGDFDVSEIAKQRGGGGHKNAAGFTIPIGCAGKNRQDWIDAIGQAQYDADVGDFKTLNSLIDEIMFLRHGIV